MDRRGGQSAGSSSQGRNAWANPLNKSQPQSVLRPSAQPKPPPPSTKVPVKNPPMSFDHQPAAVDSAYSTSEDDSESGGEGETRGCDVEKLESTIMAEYPSTENMDDTGVAKIRALLLPRRSGATSCLICLEKVRATDPVWDCKVGCHAIFHLICIQSWARQALNAAALRSLGQLSGQHFPAARAEAEEKACWHCPKCRSDYPKSELPREYRCFCGKQENPENDPWLAPHTCGEKCGLDLPGNCGHECVLLCHPGPCPTCPQLLNFRCFCGADSELRRCGHRNFSCGKACKKLLSCGKHKCENACHDGECPPCSKTAIHKCQCGRTSLLRACAESDFRCENPCGQQLSCQKHWCDRGCHAGPCGECALSGTRSCPCGKVEHKGIACDVAVPTCRSTCEKVLPCEIHRCSERCHYGPCKEICRVVLNKSCRCGSLKKEVPCHQELLCERKCQRMRDCERHACKRRCCDGDCPLCSEVCGRRLRCGTHKCPAPCHRGLCAPCPVNVQITCACGETAIQVPCGTERTQRPPRCSKLCAIPPRCSHGSNCKPHRCHYGTCPQCQLPCKANLPCGHSCKGRCHGPQPPPNPEYTIKPKRKKGVHDSNSNSTGEPCPPCSERIVKKCVGKHSGSERTMVCSQSSEFQCNSVCGNPLACGNHTCRSTCHFVTVPRSVVADEVLERTVIRPPGADLPNPSDAKAEGVWGKYGSSPPLSIENPTGGSVTGGEISDDARSVDSCEKCSLPCQKKRAAWCSHPCSRRCHIGECKPCKAVVKRACHCGALVHSFECSSFNSASEAARAKLLPCGGPCHRKLPNCAHLCPDICHPGACPTATDSCRKKVTVRCACQRIKKEWLCCDVQAAQRKDTQKGTLPGVGLLSCDKECLRLAAERSAKEETEELRHRKSKEPEVKVPTVKASKKRKGHNLADERAKNSRFQEQIAVAGRWLLTLLVVFCVILFAVYGYKGLVALSRWMDARDAARPRRRMPGSF